MQNKIKVNKAILLKHGIRSKKLTRAQTEVFSKIRRSRKHDKKQKLRRYLTWTSPKGFESSRRCVKPVSLPNHNKDIEVICKA